MSRMQRLPARFTGCLKQSRPAIFPVLVSAVFATTAVAQTEPTYTMPIPDITLVPNEGKVLVPAKVITVATCGSEVNILWQQRNTLAHVTGTIESSSCPASHGEYTFVIAIRDENGERSTFDVTETWQRSDDLPISFVKDYPIPENVDLTRVNVRGLRCTCDELPAE